MGGVRFVFGQAQGWALRNYGESDGYGGYGYFGDYGEGDGYGYEDY